MSVHVSSFVWKQIKTSIAQKLVLLKLADNCNDDGYCYPSVATIASECGMSERYVQKIVKQLVDDGQLLVDNQSGKKTPNGYTNVYYVVKYRETNNIVSKPSDLRATGEQQDTPKDDGVNNSTPLSSDGVNNSTPQGVNNSTPKPSVKPSVNTTTPPTTQQPEVVSEPKAPVTKSDELLPVVDTKLSAEDYKAYIAVINQDFKLYKGRDMKLFHQLRGTSKQKGIKEYAFTDKPVDLAELKAFVAWYRRTYPNISLPQAPDKIASRVEEFRQSVQKRNPVTPMQPVNDPYKIEAEDIADIADIEAMVEKARKKIKGEAA